MIIDTIENLSKYTSLHPLFAKALEYIKQSDLGSMADGKYEIEGDKLRAIVTNKKGMTSAESTAKFECHDKHIDIQICIKGVETIGWKPRASCTEQKGEYNAEKDVVFYNDPPDTFFELKDGQFGIFYPEDVHAPMIGADLIKKMVIKVKI